MPTPRRYRDPATFEVVEVPDPGPSPPVRWGWWLAAGVGLLLLGNAIVWALLLIPWGE